MRLSAFEQTPRETSESPLSSANVSFSSPITPGPIIKSPDIKEVSPIIEISNKMAWSSSDSSPPKECMDVDRSIESMEVEETQNLQKTTIESTQDQVLLAISRILLVSWTEPSDSSIYVPDVLQPNDIDFQDLVSQTIMDVLQRFVGGGNPLQGLRLTPSESDSGMDSPEDVSSLPILPSTSSERKVEKKPTDPALAYLMSSYARVAVETRNNPKVGWFSPFHVCICFEAVGAISKNSSIC